MSPSANPTIVTQLRSILSLTHTEVQVAQARSSQARTEAVRRELLENAQNGRARAQSIEAAIRELGHMPTLLGPLIGRISAGVKTIIEQAQPFDEALLGDLALEHQLLDRARYIKALATADDEREILALADRLITAHSTTVEWLTTILAEDALGGPAALRRTPGQAATGSAVRLANVPATWFTRGLDRAIDTIRSVPSALGDVLSWGAHTGDVTSKAITASRDAALAAAEKTTREEGADNAADVLRSVRNSTGTLDPEDLPIEEFDELNVSQAVVAVKELSTPSDLRTIIAYEEAHKNRHGVISATQSQLAAIAREVVGTDLK